MNEKSVDISNFIAVYDNYITPEECDKAIKFFENQSKFNNTINRSISEQTSSLKKKDEQYFSHGGNIDIWWQELKTMMVNYDLAFQHYCSNVGAKESYDVDKFLFTTLKIQKTLPTEGYHIWHIEHGKGFDNEARAFVFSIYLNDVEEGGETEFLHFSKRVKPKKGRIVIVLLNLL
tara:strand:+ start:125 stop:652 length:528 start_codon:yes stop_codon:yes gene_type:complete